MPSASAWLYPYSKMIGPRDGSTPRAHPGLDRRATPLLPHHRPVTPAVHLLPLLAAYTGARRGELLYLRWHAIDLDAAEITFGGSTAVVRGQRVEGTTKGGRSRTVSIDSETIAILRAHHRQQAAERLAAGSAWNDSGGLVFTRPVGRTALPRYGQRAHDQADQRTQQVGHSPSHAAPPCPAA